MGSQISTSVTIISSLLGWQAISLTNFDNEDEPQIAAGSKVEIAGAFFNFPTDESINASSWTAITTGNTAYIALTPAGTAGSQTVSASWTDTEPVWSTSKQGWYASASSTVRVIGGCKKLGASIYQTKKIYITGQDSQYNNISEQLPYKPYGINNFIGSPITVTANSNLYITKMSSKRIAVHKPDGIYGTLQAYDFIGSAFTALQGTATTSSNFWSITALNETDIAAYNAASDLLTTYRFSGTSWSIVGSSLSIVVNSNDLIFSISALNETDIAYIDTYNGQIRTYRFSGSAWSMIGSALSVSTSGTAIAFAALSSTRTVYINNSLNNIYIYGWSGSVWTLLTSLSFSNTSPAVAALNEDTFVVTDGGLNAIRMYRFIEGTMFESNGVIFQVGEDFSITSTYPRLASLDSTKFIYAEGTTSSNICAVETYKLL